MEAVAARQRLLEALQSGQCVAPVGQRLGIVGPDGQRAVAARQRLVMSAKARERHATVVEGLRIGRVQRRGLVVTGDGLVEAPQGCEGDAPVVVGIGVVRIEGQRPVEARERFPRATQCVQYEAEIGQYDGIGPEGRGAADERQRLLVLPHLMVCDAEHVQGVAVVRIALENGGIMCRRLLETPLLVQRQGRCQQVLQGVTIRKSGHVMRRSSLLESRASNVPSLRSSSPMVANASPGSAHAIAARRMSENRA